MWIAAQLTIGFRCSVGMLAALKAAFNSDLIEFTI